MDDDRSEGKANEVKGSAKETWGKTTGDKETERSGKADKAEGKLQERFGKAKDTVRGKE